MLSEGTFTGGQAGFTANILESARANVSWQDEVRIAISQAGTADWNIQLLHKAKIEAGQTYTLCYTASAAQTGRIMAVQIDADADGIQNASTAWATLSKDANGDATAIPVMLTTERTDYQHTFTATESDNTARVNFSMGDSAIDVTLDNIGLYEGDACGVPGLVALPQTGGGVGNTIEAESLNEQDSKFYQLERNGSGLAVGFFGAGSLLCYDNIDLTDVNSIVVHYARNGADVPTDGRFAILAWAADTFVTGMADTDSGENRLNPADENTINLGEKFTTSTGSWSRFEPLTVGLEPHAIGNTQLCLFGLESGGVGNIDKFTLSNAFAANDGTTPLSFNAPVPNKGVLPLTVELVTVPDPNNSNRTTKQRRVLVGGQQMSLAGMSYFWSSPSNGSDAFYNRETVNYLVDNRDVKLVRAAMAADDDKGGDGKPISELGGYITRPFINQHAVEEVIHAAIANDIYVIIDWHAHKAEDYTEQAVAFFKAMAERYGQYPNVIYEIYNEPVNTPWPTIKNYAEEVIAAIRQIDPDNLITVGTGFFSQNVDDAAEDPITGFDNIAYTLHFYAKSHGQGLRNKAFTALRGRANNNYKNAIALFITEWGLTAADGGSDGNLASDNEINAWLDFMKEQKIHHANWAISSHGQASAAIKKGASTRGDWQDNDLTQGGRKIKAIIRENNRGLNITP